MVKLYVEGGGDTKALKTKCREGFTSFLTKAGITERPRVVACGSRQNAYEDYCTAVGNGETAFLLVDSECVVDSENQAGEEISWKPWQHLQDRKDDKWGRPAKAGDLDCHLMTQVMESWFVADRKALALFFGRHFKETKLPSASRDIEAVGKLEIYQALKDATNACEGKGQYGKGSHSFDILRIIDPSIVVSASPWAKRFVNALKNKR